MEPGTQRQSFITLLRQHASKGLSWIIVAFVIALLCSMHIPLLRTGAQEPAFVAATVVLPAAELEPMPTPIPASQPKAAPQLPASPPTPSPGTLIAGLPNAAEGEHDAPFDLASPATDDQQLDPANTVEGSDVGVDAGAQLPDESASAWEAAGEAAATTAAWPTAIQVQASASSEWATSDAGLYGTPADIASTATPDPAASAAAAAQATADAIYWATANAMQYATPSTSALSPTPDPAASAAAAAQATADAIYWATANAAYYATPTATSSGAVEMTPTATPTATSSGAVEMTPTATPTATSSGAMEMTPTATPTATSSGAMEMTPTATATASTVGATEVAPTATATVVGSVEPAWLPQPEAPARIRTQFLPLICRY
jgi:hypothetical protein